MTASQAPSGHGVGAPALGYQHSMSIAVAPARSELVDIVNRSYRLGFCRWSVATALGASQHELALIDEQTAAEPGRDHRQELVDVGQLRQRPARSSRGQPTVSTRYARPRYAWTVVRDRVRASS